VLGELSFGDWPDDWLDDCAIAKDATIEMRLAARIMGRYFLSIGVSPSVFRRVSICMNGIMN
jgi:hypothetical protein